MCSMTRNAKLAQLLREHVAEISRRTSCSDRRRWAAAQPILQRSVLGLAEPESADLRPPAVPARQRSGWLLGPDASEFTRAMGN